MSDHLDIFILKITLSYEEAYVMSHCQVVNFLHVDIIDFFFKMKEPIPQIWLTIGLFICEFVYATFCLDVSIAYNEVRLNMTSFKINYKDRNQR